MFTNTFKMVAVLIQIIFFTLVSTSAAVAQSNLENTQGRVLFSIKNKDGGTMQFFDIVDHNSCDGARIAKSWSRKQDDVYGCWYYEFDTGTVSVTWFSPVAGYVNRTYDIEDATLNKEIFGDNTRKKEKASKKNNNML